tara:strand:- start:3108 stop:4589 length:1482 start_codon:yes stop_codon:yes gene_type:complete
VSIVVELTQLTIAEAASMLSAGHVSAEELLVAHLEVGENADKLNAMITRTTDRALKQARQSDHRRVNGESLGPMDGIPIAVKDLFCTKGVKTTAASKILEGFVPSYESTVTQNLWSAGAVLLGKTNLDEFAMGSANMTSYFGPVKNPWRARSGPAAGKDIVSGGSSGGSAAIVAARAALGAIGTDTGGSIRQPASFCGIVGMKPTYGRCSRWGIIAFASSLDQAGPMARCVEDTAIMLQAMAGHDPNDSTSASIAVPDFCAALGDGVKGLRVGIPKEYTMNDMPAEVQATWDQGREWLEHAGATCTEISLPYTDYALPCYYIVAPAEASSNLARYDGVRYGLRIDGDTLDEMYQNTRGAGFGPEVRRRIMIGTYVLSAGYYDAYYVKAQKVRSLIARDFETSFFDVDVILTPTAPSSAFAIGEKMDDPLAMYLNDIFTVPASMAGLPAISVPTRLDGAGLPLGLQLIGRAFDEDTIFRAAKVLEDAAHFKCIP